MIMLCDQIAAQMGELYQCSRVNGYTRIRTPFMYPDGDMIDVFMADDGTLTDLGETTRWLRAQTVAARRSAKQTRLVHDTCQTAGVNFLKGQLLLSSANETLADDLMRLSQACLRVADLWFTFRNRSIEPITEEVAVFFDDHAIHYDRGRTTLGRSGRSWTVDFHTRQGSTSSLVQILSTGAKGASHRIAEHTLAMWHDLSHLTYGVAGVKFVSLFDDTANVWGAEDFALLSDLSEVAMWNRPDELIRALVA